MIFDWFILNNKREQLGKFGDWFLFSFFFLIKQNYWSGRNVKSTRIQITRYLEYLKMFGISLTQFLYYNTWIAI